MKISLTNTLLNTTPIVTVGAGVGDPSVITSPDHSSNYVSGSNSTMTIDFGLTLNTTYVGVSGHNLGDSVSGGGSISLQDGATVILTASFDRNKIVMFNFDIRTFTNLRLVLTADGGTTNGSGIFVSYIAAGVNFEVPNNGEIAGYSLAQLTRPQSIRVTSNSNAAPTALTRKRKPIPVTLTLPDIPSNFVATTWQDFLDFTIGQPFFLNNSDTTFATAILCSEPKYSAPKTHQQTRQLRNISIKFNAFNGL